MKLFCKMSQCKLLDFCNEIGGRNNLSSSLEHLMLCKQISPKQSYHGINNLSPISKELLGLNIQSCVTHRVPTTNDVFVGFSYERDTVGRHPDDIYNPCVPIGNQYTVEEHNKHIESAKNSIKESENKPFRIDYHTGDTAQFMAMCREMHINPDNTTQCIEFKNKMWYAEGYYDKIVKCKYFIMRGDEKIERCEYVGLTSEQVIVVNHINTRKWWNIF